MTGENCFLQKMALAASLTHKNRILTPKKVPAASRRAHKKSFKQHQQHKNKTRTRKEKEKKRKKRKKKTLNRKEHIKKIDIQRMVK